MRVDTEHVAWYEAYPLNRDGKEYYFGYDGKSNRIVKRVVNLYNMKETYWSAKPKDAYEVKMLPFRYPTNKGKKWALLDREPKLPLMEGGVYNVKINEISPRGDGITIIDKCKVYVPGAKKGMHTKIKIEKISNKIAFSFPISS